MWTEPWLLPAALIAEACIGYPAWLYARIGHPVVWLGRLIEMLESAWNRSTFSDATRKALGVATMVIVAGVAALGGLIVQQLSASSAVGVIVVVLVATSGLAQRSLYTHVNDVLQSLLAHDLVAARTAVARIVGRDTAQLDESGVAAAALESLAESFNDGVIAPAFWLGIAGLPGLFAYKAINTADSLIGHREPRWRAFGWAAARIDDAVNLIPARFAGVLLAAAAGRGFRVMLRDAARHASPNAGWPEAAMAGALSIQLGGPSLYDGEMHERPVFGHGARAQTEDLQRGLRIYVRALGLLWVAVGAIATVIYLLKD